MRSRSARRVEPVTMRVHSEAFGSTTLEFGEHAEYETRLEVPQFTLDEFMQREGVPLPDILKLDTQGSEHAILSRASLSLEHARVVFAETWFTRGYGPQTPLITELTELLDGHDFQLVELGHRFYDDHHHLYGCDAFYLKRSFLAEVAPVLPDGTW